MNRRGHIGTILMVFGALLLVGVTLYSFYGFKDDIKSLDAEFRGMSIEMEDTRDKIGNYMTTLIFESIKQASLNKFEEDFKNKLKELTKIEVGQEDFKKSFKNLFENIRDNVFVKIIDGEFKVEKFGDTESYILSIKNLSFSVNPKDREKSVSSIDYNFSITSKFNKKEIEYLTIG